MTPRSLIYILVVTLLLALGQNILKLGLQQVGGFTLNLPTLLADLKAALGNRLVWFGFLVTGLSVLVWMDVLSKVKLSAAYPLISLSYVFGAILAYFIFNETLELSGWVGISFIITGTFLLIR